MLYRFYSWFWSMYSYVQLACGAVPGHWRGNPWFYRILHYSLVVAAFVVASVFSHRMVPPSGLGNLPSLVKDYWCGFLFLLTYVSIRFVVYLIGLLRESDGSDWPMIDHAWQAGLDGMEREGLDFQRLPVFLVAGTTPESERRFFEGVQCHWQVIEPPLDRPAAMRFYANQDGVFLACSGFSATSMQARMHRGTSVVESPPPQLSVPASTSFGGTMRGIPAMPPPHSTAPETTPSASQKSGFGGTLRNLASLVQSTLGLSALSGVREGSTGTELRALSNGELEVSRAQMEYLALILKRDRTYCPLNGVLQLLPFDWVNRRREHSKLVRSIRKDLEALSHALSLQYPFVLGFTGIDTLPGYEAFIRRCRELDPHSHLARAGSGVMTGAALNEFSANYLSQVTSHCFRDKAYEAFLVDLDNRQNARLYNLVCALDDEVDNLKHILIQIGAPNPTGTSTARFAGCYLAALGDSTDYQAFLQGLLFKMLQEQNQVAYTPSELRKDRWMKQIAIVIFMISACVFMAAAYMGWILVQNRTQESKTTRTVPSSVFTGVNWS